MSIILGIDPGSRITGYGVIRQNGRHLYYLGSGCIRTSEKELPGRLKQIYAGVSEIITQFQPETKPEIFKISVSSFTGTSFSFVFPPKIFVIRCL